MMMSKICRYYKQNIRFREKYVHGCRSNKYKIDFNINPNGSSNMQ